MAGKKRRANKARALKYARYLVKSTCSACSKVFRKAKYAKAHIESGHKTMVGFNPNYKKAKADSSTKN